MKNKWKKIAALFAVVALALSVAAAGCTGGQDENGEEEEKQYSVAVVFATGGLGDQSFNDMAYDGLQRANDEFGDQFNFEYGEPSEISDFSTYQQRYAESGNHDLIICVGFLQTSSLNETAQQYPDQDFMLIDSVVNQPNVKNVVFKEHEGEFLAGALASLMTQHTEVDGINEQERIGFVGGMETPLIKKFETGYWAGAKYVNEDVTIDSGYAGGWSDPTAGNELAQGFYSNGADIIAHAAGGTGSGVIEASKEKGFYSIGVDSNQDYLGTEDPDNPEAPSHTMTSMMKRVDNAVYDSIESVINEEFETGTTEALGVEEGGVSLTAMEYSPYVPDSLATYVKEDIKQAIIDGEIEVPSTMDAYESWVEENGGAGQNYDDLME